MKYHQLQISELWKKGGTQRNHEAFKFCIQSHFLPSKYVARGMKNEPIAFQKCQKTQFNQEAPVDVLGAVFENSESYPVLTSPRRKLYITPLEAAPTESCM